MYIFIYMYIYILYMYIHTSLLCTSELDASLRHTRYTHSHTLSYIHPTPHICGIHTRTHLPTHIDINVNIFYTHQTLTERWWEARH